MNMHENLKEMRQRLTDMVSFEGHMEGALTQGSKIVRDYPEAFEALDLFRGVVGSQRKALQELLDGMGGSGPSGTGVMATLDMAALLSNAEDPYPVSRALHIISTAFNHAAFGYAMLHTVAHRLNQRMGEADTAGLAEQFQHSCIAAAQTIHRLIPDVVIWEMGRDKECMCTYPSCSLGICLCWHSHIDSLLPVSPTEEDGVLVRLPKSNSAASKAGLQQGDIILAVDGQSVQNYQDLQAEIRKRNPGDSVLIRVFRRPGDSREIAITLP